MFGRSRHLDNPQQTPRSLQKAIEKFQDGTITYDEFKQRTSKKIKPAGFRSGRANYHKLLLDATPRGSPPNMQQHMTQPGAAARRAPKASGPGKIKPASFKSRLGAAGQQSLQQTVPNEREQKAGAEGMSADDIAAYFGEATSEPPKPTDTRPYSIDSLSKKLPEHQLKVLMSDPMYTPDPEVGLSRWPIPGMQGNRTPFVDVPFATEGQTHFSSTQKDSADRGIESTGKYERGCYHSEGLGKKPKWDGPLDFDAITKVQRCYEESGMMTILLPGQGAAAILQKKRDPKKRTLFI